MNDSRIRDVVIVGGGTAGWMAAAALSATMGEQLRIRLVESEQIGTVGVGEATIPAIRLFNGLVGIDENEFICATQGSFKLGIEFIDWGRVGESYMHVFGQLGQSLDLIEFWQYWLRGREEAISEPIGHYSFNEEAARNLRFARVPRIPNTHLDGISYAFHFDAGLYAKFLRGLAEKNGATRTEGMITGVSRNPENGHIRSITLDSGEEIAGELFIDCSGFRGLLIEQELETGYVDWTHWLLCDRAIAVPTENVGPPRPYTQSIAHPAGWQWRIPLQHRTGNGHVFSTEYISEDEATALLLKTVEGKPLADPRTIPFKTGMRRKAWNANVIALGLSSGFIEPLESTSIHLIQNGIAKLISHFPDREFRQANVDAYNRRIEYDYERIRDFIILHYHANQRDEAFWTRCREMDVPDTLRDKIDLFRATGRIFREQEELFVEVGWFQVLNGQNIVPETYHPLADALTKEELAGFLRDIRTIVANNAARLPTHAEFIAATCAAQAPGVPA
ncbi:tryptophan halogenase family protein [Qipengyuania soli]|uniref:Tryptophan 7-halogenase n=1 Tax=Qipengyuania soli TaxID=2782568 RepID=A0A7S8F2P1_9SPHN|nr:tryptophan halogenase family protein [Qipengyuania soli]QPC98037.1 tryptophan 7-halogenase [Qipengyuania soli]